MSLASRGPTRHYSSRLYRHFVGSCEGGVTNRGHSRLVSEFQKTFDMSQWRSIWAVTLTLKQALHHDDGSREFLDLHECEKNFRQFMRRLNGAVFRNAASRYWKRLRVIPVHEKGRDTRFHTHAALEGPERLTDDAFAKLIRTSWGATPWADRLTDIQPNADQGWTNYLLKLRGKSGLEHWPDCIDWGSFHNPTADA